VEAVKILCYSNEKNMALVKFYSMEDSFEAIAHLHNEVFSGRKMQISFTKSKV
jgi:RNA recognition motif-containing protein